MELRSLRGVTLYSRSNTAHVPSGEHGGEFTSGPGGGSKAPGKHHARNERRKARKKQLAKVRRETHAATAKLRAKHRKERDKTKTKGRKEGATRSVIGSRLADLKAKHRKEREATRKELKAKIHEQLGKPSGKKSEKFRQAKDKPLSDLRKKQFSERKEAQAELKQEWRDLKKEHRGERKDLRRELREERKDLRETYKADRKEMIESGRKDHRDDAKQIKGELHKKERVAERMIGEAVATGKPNRAAKIKARLEEVREEHAQRLRDNLLEHDERLHNELAELAKRHKAEIADHKQAVREAFGDQRKEHREAHRELAKGHQDVRDDIRKMERDERKELVTETREKVHGKPKTGQPRRERSYGEGEMDRRALDQIGNLQRNHAPGESCESFDYGPELGLSRRGNPYHDEHGQFASGPGGGHAEFRRRPRKKDHKYNPKALARLQEKWDKHPVKAWPLIHESATKDTYHVRVTKHAYYYEDSYNEKKYNIDFVKHDWRMDQTDTDYSEESNKLENALKIGDQMHRRHSREFAQENKAQAKKAAKYEAAIAKQKHKHAEAANYPIAGRSIGGISPPSGRFGRHQTHKASSAEAILHACLKRRGWTSAWREGRLTGKQHLQLLEDIRQYGRRWLRHEAEGFFQAHGINRDLPALQDDVRALYDWAEGVPGVCPETSGSMGGLEAKRSIGSRLLSPLKRFFDRARSFVHELVFAGVMALKGESSLSAAETNAADQAAAIQAKYFDNFEREVIANPPQVLIDPSEIQTTTQVVEGPPMTAGQFVARAELYSTAAWQGAQNVVRQTVVTSNIAKMERRIYDREAMNCHECPPLEALGWQPIGTLPAIGDTVCNGRCRCHFLYSDQTDGPTVLHKPTIDGKRPVRKIKLKTTPYTKSKKLKRPETPEDIAAKEKLKQETTPREPTHDEIKAEVDKFIAGKPSKITITPPGEPPRLPLGLRDPREGGGWKDAQSKPTDFVLPPESTPVAPAGYTTTTPSRYDAAGNPIIE